MGPLFTWSNKQVGNYIAKKLDSVLVNEEFMAKFPPTLSEYKVPRFSDHGSCHLEFGKPLYTKTGPFKFFNFLLKHRDFFSSVKKVWDTEGM